MEAAVDVIAHAGLDGVSDAAVDGLLSRLRRPLTQLQGLQARAGATLQARRLRARPPGASIEGTLADHRRSFGEQQRLAPGEAQRVLDAGRAAADGTATGQAVRDGDVGASQARTIGRVLEGLVGAQRDEVEAELVELAARLDPVAFGRAARRLLARIQPEQLARQQRRQEFDRRFRATDTEDGGFAFSGLLYGTAAETARVALRAFRRPDSPDEHRTPEQRGADAFEQLCAVALAAGEAPAQHGVRPQVVVTIDAADLVRLQDDPARAAGTFVASGQPVSGPQLRQLLDDCTLLRVVLDAEKVPVEVSTTVRTVPAGLWRALLIRDGGCRWPGCDAPAAWCDVAHAKQAFTDGGRLSLDNAVLLCRRHHRRFDSSNLTVHIDGTNVTFPGLAGTTTDPPDRRAAPQGSGVSPAGSEGHPAGSSAEPPGRNSTAVRGGRRPRSRGEPREPGEPRVRRRRAARETPGSIAVQPTLHPD